MSTVDFENRSRSRGLSVAKSPLTREFTNGCGKGLSIAAPRSETTSFTNGIGRFHDRRFRALPHERWLEHRCDIGGHWSTLPPHVDHIRCIQRWVRNG
jgi:hypothetical protein